MFSRNTQPRFASVVPGTSVQSEAHLTVSLFICIYGISERGKVKGAVLAQNIPPRVRDRDEEVAETNGRELCLPDTGSLTRGLTNGVFFYKTINRIELS